MFLVEELEHLFFWLFTEYLFFTCVVLKGLNLEGVFLGLQFFFFSILVQKYFRVFFPLLEGKLFLDIQ